MPTFNVRKPGPERQGDALPPKPAVQEVDFLNIPEELKAEARWVVWRYEWNPEKRRKDGRGEKGDWDKPPCNARTGRHASSTNPSDWVSYVTARRKYLDGGWDGLGFIPLTEIPGIDLDTCLDPATGRIEAWAQQVVNEANSYTEISPSGTGLRIWVKAPIPGSRRRNGRFEIYNGLTKDGRPGGRYLTVTGHHLEGTPARIRRRTKAVAAICERMFRSSEPALAPTPVLPALAVNGKPETNGKADTGGEAKTKTSLTLTDDELIAKAKAAKNGAKFSRLWNGDTSGYPSHSEAVLALCDLLAFWAGSDPSRIDRLFRKSGLFSGAWREGKWDRLGQDTIRKALAGRTEFYGHPVDGDDGEGGVSAKGKGKGKDSSQATLVVEMVGASGAELFHTPGSDSQAYVSLPINGHRETWLVKSPAFSNWVRMTAYKTLGKVPNGQAIADALNTLAGRALFDGPEHPVAVRLAEHDGCIWLDLGGPDWRVVRIGPDGWEVVEECPVRFNRRRGMLALPTPVSGGNLKALRKLVNLPDDADWRLFLAWLVAALRPDRPFPVLTVNGEQGSAKTTLCRMARGLIDPNEAPLRLRPKNPHDLIIAARNGWVVAFDNLSGISDDLSDALCCLATGGGFGTRQLYTDDDEKLFSAKRPVLLNGIEDVATRPDLIDRAIALTLPSIPDDGRRDEDALWRRYERMRPRVLGALLEAVATGLQNLPGVKLDSKPRMADFVTWVVACCPALDMTVPEFLAAYHRNRAVANDAALETTPIVQHLMELVEKKTWSGTAASLLRQLEHPASDNDKRKKSWPQSPRGLSGILKRLQPNLRRAGIIVEFTDKFTRHGKIIRIERRLVVPSPQDD